METLATETDGPSLRRQVEVVRRRKWLVLGVVVLALLGAGIATAAMPSRYASSVQVVVGQGNSLFQPGSAGAVQPFTATMASLAKSPFVAEQTIVQAHLRGMTVGGLLKDVSVSYDPTAAVLNLTVESSSPAGAQRIASAYSRVFSQLVRKRFVGSATKATGGTPASPAPTATVWGHATYDAHRVSPRTSLNLVVGLLVGLVLGLVAAFLRDHFDRRLRTREDAEAAYGVPVLGEIPAAAGAREEAFRMLRANLQDLDPDARVLLVSSATPEQGKSALAAHLARALAQSGAGACVVEADLRRPELHEPLELDGDGPGLADVLAGRAEFEQVVRAIPVLNGTQAKVLTVLPSGPVPPNPAELLGSGRMAETLARLRDQHDVVLIDAPPLLSVVDALDVGKLADGVILAVRSDRATPEEASEARSLLARRGLRLLGIVLTEAPASPPRYANDGSSSPRDLVARRARAAARLLERRRPRADTPVS